MLLKILLLIISVVLMEGQLVTWAPDGQGAGSEPFAVVP